MKVILTKSVPKLGEVGDICEVAPGYGRNYLIPQGLAILATAGARRQVEDLKRTERRRLARLRSDAEQLADRIRGARLEFAARVGETGRLYGSITASDIAAALLEHAGVEIDRRKIHLEEPLRTLGEHEVTVHFLPQVEATIVVNIEPEQALAAAEGRPGSAEVRPVVRPTSVGAEDAPTQSPPISNDAPVGAEPPGEPPGYRGAPENSGPVAGDELGGGAEP